MPRINNYRVYFDQYLSGVELVPDTNFDDATKWTLTDEPLLGMTGSIAGGVLSATANPLVGVGGIVYVYSNANIFEKGHRYRITLNVKTVTFGGGATGYFYINVYVGRKTVSKLWFNADTSNTIFYTDVFDCDETYSQVYIQITDRTNVTPPNTNLLEIESISVKEWLWNTTAYELPHEPNKYYKTIEKSQIFPNFYAESISDIEFTQEAYNYLKTKSVDDEVKIKIERYDGSAWVLYYTGYIYIANSKHNRNSITCEIDSPFSRCFSNGGSEVVNIRHEFHDRHWYTSQADPNKAGQYIEMHDATGAYSYTDFMAYNLYFILENIIHEVSDMEISIKSTLFTVTYQYLALCEGQFLYDGNILYEQYIEFTLNDLLTNLNKIFTIGISPITENNIFKLRIEQIATLRAGAGITLSNIDNYEYTFNTEKIPATIKNGYIVDGDLDTDGAVNYVTSVKNSELLLDNVCNYIRHSKFILDKLSGVISTGLNPYKVLIQYEDAGAGVFQSTIFAVDGYAKGYNGDIEEIDNINNMVVLLPFTYAQSNKATGVVEVIGTETLVRVFEFPCHLTDAQIAIIDANKWSLITVTGANNTSGYLTSYVQDICTNVSKITMYGT